MKRTKVEGQISIKKPMHEPSGSLKTYFSDAAQFSSMEIRNFSQWPIRFNNGKTLMPLEVWSLGMDEMDLLKKDQLSFTHITTGTASPNDAYTQPYAIEVNGIILKECPCKVCV